MKIIFAVIGAAFVGSGCVSTTAGTTSDVHKNPPFLWQVSKAHESHYLFAAPPQGGADFHLSSTVEKALGGSSCFIGAIETAPEDRSNELEKGSLSVAQAPLSTRVGEKTWKEIQRRLPQYKEKDLLRLRPGMLYFLLLAQRTDINGMIL